MKAADFVDLELNIARARIVLSLVALLSIYVDPTTPDLSSWMPLTTGAFTIDVHTLAVLAIHLAYGVAIYLALSRRVATAHVPTISTALDLFFASAVALFTEGATSPAFAFFTFAIIAVGCRAGFRGTLAVTFSSIALYLAVIVFLARGAKELYVMRPAYLAVTGYLIGFLGQQSVNREARIRERESAAERHGIARCLHDSYAPGLAGVNLRLQSCRELLLQGCSADALAELTELQAGVIREFDEVRTYIHSLADLDRVESAPGSLPVDDTRFRVRADFVASGLLVEQVLQIMLEGMRNTRRHAGARSATIEAADAADMIRIAIDDDGVGFHTAAETPWSIASRVAEVGGRLRIVDSQRLGAHLEIEMPIGSHGENADSPDHRG